MSRGTGAPVPVARLGQRQGRATLHGSPEGKEPAAGASGRSGGKQARLPGELRGPRERSAVGFVVPSSALVSREPCDL